MWEISLSLQIEAFLWSLFFGAVFCFAFDILNTLGIVLKLPKAAVFVLDILFFTALGFFDFCLLLAFCNGEIRGFIFVGEIIGFYLCKKTVARIYMPLLLLFFKALQKIYKWLNKWVFNPISDFFSKTAQKCLLISQKTLLFVKKLLKYPKRLVYTKEKCPKANNRKDE